MASNVEQRDLSELFGPVEENVEEQGIVLFLIEDQAGIRPSAQLRESMEKRGQLQPVILNAVPGEDRYRIVDGRRRVAAARALGWRDIRAYIYEINSIVEASLAVTVNAVRGANPLSDALAIIDLANAGYAERDIARATGLPVGTIRKRMKLAALNDEVFRAMREGKVAIGVAERIAGLPTDRQNDLAGLLEAKSRITGEDVDAASRVSVEAAVAALAPALFGEPELPRLSARDRLRASLRDIANSYLGSVDEDDWRAACEAAWREIEDAA